MRDSRRIFQPAMSSIWGINDQQSWRLASPVGSSKSRAGDLFFFLLRGACPSQAMIPEASRH